MPDEESYAKGRVKGYEEGLKEAWEELISLTMKGYTPREIQILAKSKRASISEKVEQRRRHLASELGIQLGDEVAGVGATAEVERVEPGMTYIIKDRNMDHPITVLKGELADGAAGLCILRTPPAVVKKRFAIDCSMIWLTKTETAPADDEVKRIEAVSPTDLPKLTTTIKSFLSEEKRGVIVLEGLEYLVTQNDFKSVLKFVTTIKDQVFLAKGVLLIPFDPTVFDAKDLKALEREADEE